MLISSLFNAGGAVKKNATPKMMGKWGREGSVYRLFSFFWKRTFLLYVPDCFTFRNFFLLQKAVIEQKCPCLLHPISFSLKIKVDV